jgi:hypothetical protein
MKVYESRIASQNYILVKKTKWKRNLENGAGREVVIL